MQRSLNALLVVSLICIPAAVAPADEGAFRPPAVPLVTHDPYFSVWSFHDRLTDGWSTHWTGAAHAMCSLIRIDGKPFRIAGPAPTKVPAMEQVGCVVWPTRTIYTFEADGVRVELTFTSPLLADDLDILSRPVTYITWNVRSLDDRKRNVELYLDCSAEWAVNTGGQIVNATRIKGADLSIVRVGTTEQPVLARAGDDLRIDWGYLYLATERGEGTDDVIAAHDVARAGFADTGRLPDADDARMPRAANDAYPFLATAFALGAVGAEPVERYTMVAYDDIWSIEYMQRRLRPYWRRKGATATPLLADAARDYAALMKRCAAFDEKLMMDLRARGGEPFARLAALSYRQCIAAHKLAADFDGSPMMFSKENFSNGCIGTVDVIYPAAPLFLLFNTELLKAQLTPLLAYAGSARWPHPFAPHDLGTYPLANGQKYGGGEDSTENQMPVEECGNMLLMLTAIAHIEGNADYALKYWPTVTQWAEYLRDKGLDPENQLCTDDFAGHLAHNANLSLKAILGLGGYSRLCEMAGKADMAAVYRKEAEAMAGEWQKLAADGDHYRLAFDKPGTWSQKYNLVWDCVLGLNLFPKAIAATEIAYYKTKQNRYGLPLDSRPMYTKLDWVLWTAAIAEQRADFDALVAPVYAFANETPDRVPLTDWYDTDTGRCVGFRARPVIGGVFMPMLTDAKLWKRWQVHAK
ncbi:MAG: DUF4965 domain-containing protein [Phycisphaerae bacterium]|nr:DUF4965 domain-containing protein [Phycisphaerae bacterium]